MKQNKGNPHPVSRKGRPNKATQDVRAAIAAFAEGNAGNLAKWIARVAEGTKERAPDPAKAAELYLKAIEYHIPKLGRTELTGKDEGPIKVVLSGADERI